MSNEDNGKENKCEIEFKCTAELLKDCSHFLEAENGGCRWLCRGICLNEKAKEEIFRNMGEIYL